jgi:hypothetical protein
MMEPGVQTESALTERLIRKLSADLQPVRRLRPPPVRAALWLAIVLALVGIALYLFADWHAFLARMAVPRRALECAATGLTAVTAVLAAFVSVVPGRSRWWAVLPVPPFALWLAGSGLGCLQNGWSLRGPGGFFGDSPHCFLFIVAVSVPLGIALFWALRRARPIAPLRVAALATLGVAALAAFVLEFFHPFDVTVIDLTLHLAAVALIMLAGIAVRRVLTL